MSKVIDIDGVRFESTAAIASRFNYTPDYVGRLAREGKVKANRVGRLWFVERASFETFLKETEEEKERRAAELRAERKAEREEAVAVEKTEYTQSVQKKRLLVPEDFSALAQSVAVVVCGFLVGLLGWVVTESDVTVADAYSGTQTIAMQLSEMFTSRTNIFHTAALPVAMDLGVAGSTTDLHKDKNAARAQVARLQSKPQAEVYATFPVQQYTPREVVTETVNAARSLPFSDEVQVEYKEDGVQVVRPVFPGGVLGEAYEVTVSQSNVSNQ